MRRYFFFLIFMSFLITCKGGGKNSQCVEKACNKGETKCFGNYIGVCDNSEKKYNISFCGSGYNCEKGECEARGCYPPAKKECLSETKSFLCSEDGKAKIDIPCTEDEICKEGVCILKKCEKGKKICGYNALIACKEDGSSWDVSKCKEDESCNEKTLKCEKRLCQPEKARCIDEKTSKICKLDGLGEFIIKCGSAEHCVDGFCQPLVCEVKPDIIVKDIEVIDGVLLDGEEIEVIEEDKILPELEQPSIAKVIMDGGKGLAVEGGSFSNEEVNFTSYKSAEYAYKVQQKMNALVLNFTKGLVTLEIYIYGIGLGELGKFICEGGEYETYFWLRAGKYTPEKSKDYDYKSISCEVTIEEFGKLGGRVKGKFSGTLQDAFDESQITLKDGLFNVKLTKCDVEGCE